MYLLRGTVISLAAFFLVYAFLSLIVAFVWRALRRMHSIQSADLLYGIRVLPLIGASGLVAFFTVPSFLYLEPYLTEERIGVGALGMAAAGATVIFSGVLNSARAWLRTSRFMTACLARSRRLETAKGICTYEMLDEDPVLFLAGVWRPKLVVSSGAVALLDADEIQAAMQHEVAHAKRGDNLKKLVLQLCALPWFDSLEREWVRATEVAADGAAANDEETAVNLASALIKITQFSSRTTTPELGMTLLPRNGASVTARVQRLMSGSGSTQKNSRVLWWVVLAATALAVTVHYARALSEMHGVTELLLR
ncbi:MAG TPA: M56 family metallopeptidase [Candidatus Dormibacteraeota bacterium]|nr:M56 family metallopeptidase [Candidatus Dormibacteraeota bacterium]